MSLTFSFWIIHFVIVSSSTEEVWPGPMRLQKEPPLGFWTFDWHATLHDNGSMEGKSQFQRLDKCTALENVPKPVTQPPQKNKPELPDMPEICQLGVFAMLVVKHNRAERRHLLLPAPHLPA